jgi:hypothetical protein
MRGWGGGGGIGGGYGGRDILKTFHFLYMEIIQVERRKLCKWKMVSLVSLLSRPSSIDFKKIKKYSGFNLLETHLSYNIQNSMLG